MFPWARRVDGCTRWPAIAALEGKNRSNALEVINTHWNGVGVMKVFVLDGEMGMKKWRDVDVWVM